MRNSRLATCKRLLPYSKPYHKMFALLLFFTVAILGLELLYPAFYRIFVDEAMVAGRIEVIWPTALGYLVVYLLISICKVGQKSAGNHVFLKLIPALKRRVLRTYLHMSQKEYETYDAGDLENRADRDVSYIETFYTQEIVQFFYATLNVLVIGCVMLIINWKLCIFGLCMVPLSFLFTNVVGKKVKRIWDEYRELQGEYEGYLHRTFQNWKEIKTNNLEQTEEQRYQYYRKAMAKMIRKIHIYESINNTFIGFKNLFIIRMNVYFLGGLFIIWGEISIGSMLMFMTYYEQFYKNITVMTKSMLEYKREAPFIEHALEMLERKIETRHLEKIPGEKIEISGLRFSYDGAHSTLRDISLDLDGSGEIAIAGRSGSGKSTLAKLLVGLLKPQTGTICIGGRDITTLSDDSLHRKISIVMQEPMFFNLTIRENLQFANRHAGEAEFDAACKKADIYEFISSLPDGYDTLIGERGVKLSGGQRQRLAIARILLLDPDIIVLDESTSSLDSESEKGIVKAVLELSQTKMAIVIAHRLSTIIDAKRVIVMEDGEVVAEGTHADLKRENAVYQQLFEKQYYESERERT